MLTPTPQDEPALAARFTGKGPWKKRLPEILAMLAALGRAKQSDGGWVESNNLNWHRQFASFC
ncbi:MAG: hypothetical protein Q8N89_17620 [Azonexus sp.]|nr:hypothetical protein [Azonexus sp.]